MRMSPPVYEYSSAHTWASSTDKFNDQVKKAIKMVEEVDGEVISISHGAGLGVGKGQYSSVTKEIFSAVLFYRVPVR